VKNPGTGSPNKLLFSLVSGEYYTYPILASPIGFITDTTPTFTWSKVDHATQYQLRVYKGSTLVLNKYLTTTSCSTYTCSYTQPTAMSKSTYTWKVRAYIPSSWQIFSPTRTFSIDTVGTNFVSYFTSDYAGWSIVKGSWGVSNGALKTPGYLRYVVSVVHSGTYTSTDFVARLMRLSDPSAANRMYIRGDPSSLSSVDRGWTNGYMFPIHK
jgi:hypothetical protein